MQVPNVQTSSLPKLPNLPIMHTKPKNIVKKAPTALVSHNGLDQ
jgi:hypothetical protein